MLLLIILFFIIFAIFIVELIINKDIFSPTAILCESYLLGIYLCILNAIKWNVELALTTFFTILSAILIFFIVSLFSKRFVSLNKEKNNSFSEIKINNKFYIVMIILQIFFIVLYVYWFKKITGLNLTFSNFSESMNYYRLKSAYGNGFSLSFPYYITIFVKISRCFALVTLYCFAYNFLLGKNGKFIKNIKYLLPTLLYIPLVLLNASRFDLIVFILYFMSLFNVLSVNIYHKAKNINFKNLFKVVAVVLFAVFIFSSTKTMSGRTSETSTNEDVEVYVGGAVQLLNLYIKNPNSTVDNFGEETFTSMNRFLYKVGIIKKEPKRIYLEFRKSNGISIGNVYTALRPYLHDFGYLGMLLLMTIFAIIMTIAYRQSLIRLNVKNEKVSIFVMMYSSFVYCLYLNVYSEYFYNSFFSVDTILNIIILLFLKKFLIINNNLEEEKDE